MPAPLLCVTVCSVCGEPLDDNKCFACLLRTGLDEVEDPLVLGDFEIEFREDGSAWELGSGAMGVTYRARDKVLNRSVALKVISTDDSQAKHERFLREARTAAALKHPNVAGIFQFGASPETNRCYYAMELVEGETLEAVVRREGPLKLDTALEVAIQVTRALVGAAAQGLIHRDLKPGNIMITRSDTAMEVKVIDFGLAKAINKVAETDLTHGGFIGTPTFASPEQFAGAAADARSDIYSLGVTLWYALTGEVPYPGNIIAAIRESQKNNPLPVQQLTERRIPSAAVDILRHTLAIDPTKRPASAQALLKQLETCRRRRQKRRVVLAAAATITLLIALTGIWFLRRENPAIITNEKSIAVLPFENLSDDKDNAYFASGVQDEILSNLARISDLKVISRMSVMQYEAGRARDVRTIAAQLSVNNVVEGSVRKAGNHIRVSVQLIDARTDRHLWAHNYDRTLADSVSLQGELAIEIASSVGATLSPQEKEQVEAPSTQNTAAYDAYLRGRSFMRGGSAEGKQFEGAIQSYEEAVKLDPSFALAWAFLSCAQSELYWHFSGSSPELLPAAKKAADRAVALNPNLPETHLALGYYSYYALRDFRRALVQFKEAERGLPNNADALRGVGLIERRLGHWDEAVAAMRRVVELDPRSLDAAFNLITTYRCLRRFPEVIAMADRLQVSGLASDNGYQIKAQTYWAMGNLDAPEAMPSSKNAEERSSHALFKKHYDTAIEIISKQLAETPGEGREWTLFKLGIAHQRAGDDAAARAAYMEALPLFERDLSTATGSLRFLVAEQHSSLGLIHAALGDADAAIVEGEKGVAMDPASEDPFEGPAREESLAQIYALLGDAGHAVPILGRLLRIPYGGFYDGGAIPVGILQFDPIWDPIRSDPRFQKLIAKKKV
jgi:eukaryotic-like serine/threonine-protein kinase